MTLRLAGQTFGHLRAVEPTGKRSPKGIYLWRFECIHCRKSTVRAGAQVKSDAKNHRLPKCSCMEVSKRRQDQAERRAGVLKEFSTGKTMAALADELEVSKQRIEQMLTREMDRKKIAVTVRAATRGVLNDAILATLPKVWLVRLAAKIREGGSDAERTKSECR